MKLAVLSEVRPGETRVSAIPETVRRLTAWGLEVSVQAGAGAKAFFADGDYKAAGASLASGAAEALEAAEVVLKVLAPTTDASAGRDELAMLRPGQVLVAMLAPLTSPELVRKLADAKVTSLSLDTIPRITRAQSMDVLSSMATIAGYKAVLLAADSMAKMCPMMMTPAGTLRPANALIIGAGVAGLQAIATAKRIGAVVTAIDVRPAVREQIESLGAKFIPMEVDHAAEDAGGYAADLGEEFYRAEQEIIAPHARKADMIITTALVPGRAAPRLITEAMVESMRPGSVVVDLAAPAGGNCTLCRPDQTVEHRGVKILGPLNLPATMPTHASEMFARNVATFLKEFITDEGQLNLDAENEIIQGTLITHQGKIVHEATLRAMSDREVQP